MRSGGQGRRVLPVASEPGWRVEAMSLEGTVFAAAGPGVRPGRDGASHGGEGRARSGLPRGRRDGALGRRPAAASRGALPAGLRRLGEGPAPRGRLPLPTLPQMSVTGAPLQDERLSRASGTRPPPGFSLRARPGRGTRKIPSKAVRRPGLGSFRRPAAAQARGGARARVDCASQGFGVCHRGWAPGVGGPGSVLSTRPVE